MPRLIVIRGNDTGKIFELAAGKTLRIGRRSDNELALDDSTLSRYHCEILYDGQRVRLKDNESRHGTFVNGKAVPEAELSDRDEIRVGKTCLRLRMTAELQEELAEEKPEEEEEEKKLVTLPPKLLELKEEPPAGAAEGPAHGISALLGFKVKPPENPEIIDKFPASGESGPKAASPSESKPRLLTEVGTQIRKRRTWMTFAALAAVAALIGVAALFLLKFFSRPPETPALVSIEKLSDVEVRVLNKRMLLERPPTFVLEIEVVNKTQQPMRVRLADFQAVDEAGLGYPPMNPVTQADLRDTTLSPGSPFRGNLTFELGFGKSLGRLHFQNRGIVSVE